MLNSVLIVDDTEVDQYLAKRAIEKTKLTEKIFIQSDGQEALDFLCDFEKQKTEQGESFPPEVILLDINMPGLDGFGFLEKFSELREQQTEKFSHITVIVFTSSDFAKDKERAYDHKFVKAFLTKPIQPADLMETLQAIAKSEA